MTSEDIAGLEDRVVAMFPLGSCLGDRSCTVLEVRTGRDEVVLLVRWDKDPHLYGIPISLADTRHEFYYSDLKVASDEEWLESVAFGVSVMMDTGYRATARRSLVEDYIELRGTDCWPDDGRFYLQEGGSDLELIAQRLRDDGLDPTVALEMHARKRLLVWMLAYENNSTGIPWVGHAVISRVGSGQAQLEIVETLPGVPVTLRADLAYFASHRAAERGVLKVTTTLSDPEFSLAGFETSQTSGRTLETSFLAADPDQLRAMIATDIAAGSSWGRNRDSAGRYLPTSQLGRMWHALRWGRSGRSPRMRIRAG